MRAARLVCKTCPYGLKGRGGRRNVALFKGKISQFPQSPIQIANISSDYVEPKIGRSFMFWKQEERTLKWLTFSEVYNHNGF